MFHFLAINASITLHSFFAPLPFFVPLLCPLFLAVSFVLFQPSLLLPLAVGSGSFQRSLSSIFPVRVGVLQG